MIEAILWISIGIAAGAVIKLIVRWMEKSQQRQWVGLTDEEISEIDWKQNETLHDFAKSLEAKLKEKNT